MNKYIVKLPSNWQERFPLLIAEIENFILLDDQVFFGDMYRKYKDYISDEEYQYTREEYIKKLEDDLDGVAFEKTSGPWHLYQWDLNFQRMTALDESGLLLDLPKLTLSARDSIQSQPEDPDTEYKKALNAKQGINALLRAIQLEKTQHQFEIDLQPHFKNNDVKTFTAMFCTSHNLSKNTINDRRSDIPALLQFYDDRSWIDFANWVDTKEQYTELQVIQIAQLLMFRYTELEFEHEDPLIQVLQKKSNLFQKIGQHIINAPKSQYSDRLVAHFVYDWSNALLEPPIKDEFKKFTEDILFNAAMTKQHMLDEHRINIATKGYISEKKLISWIQPKIIKRNKDIDYHFINNVISKPHLHKALVAIVEKNIEYIMNDLTNGGYFHVELWSLLHQTKNDLNSTVRESVENTLRQSNIEQQLFCEQLFASKPDPHKRRVLEYIMTRTTLAYALEIAENDTTNILDHYPKNRWYAMNLNDPRTSYLHHPEFPAWLADPNRERDTTSADQSNRGLSHLLRLFPHRKNEIKAMIEDHNDYETNIGKNEWDTIKLWLQQDILQLAPNEDVDAMVHMYENLMDIKDPEELAAHTMKHLIQRVSAGLKVSDTELDVPNDSWVP